MLLTQLVFFAHHDSLYAVDLSFKTENMFDGSRRGQISLTAATLNQSGSPFLYTEWLTTNVDVSTAIVYDDGRGFSESTTMFWQSSISLPNVDRSLTKCFTRNILILLTIVT